MSLIDAAIRDAKNITGNLSGFGVTVTFTSPDGSTTATIAGLHTLHHLGLDLENRPVNSKTVWLTISESALVAAGYNVRENGEVKMAKHRCSVKDNSGITKNYIVRQYLPDQTLGMITLQLDDFKP